MAKLGVAVDIASGQSSLGCSIVEITGLDGQFDFGSKPIRKADGWGGYYVEYNEEVVNLYKDKEGYTKFREWVNQTAGNSTQGHGGIALFCDTNSDGNREGHKLAKLLRDHGEQVEESEAYKNPRHGGKCTLWVWYFRKKPVNVELPIKRLSARGPVPKPRRKAKL